MRMTEKLEAVGGATARASPPLGTKARILDSAIRLFAERGFDSVSVRDITEHANANPAAIGYHFGSKEALVRVAISLVFAPLNKDRMHELRERQEAANGRALDIVSVVDALVRPTIHAVLRPDGYGQYYARYSVLAYAWRNSFVDEALSNEHDTLAMSFIEAFSATLPGVDREKICWCYDFAIGSIIHILLDRERGHRLERLSGGLCDTDDPETITARLVSFVVGGMQSFAIRGSPQRANREGARRRKPRSP